MSVSAVLDQRLKATVGVILFKEKLTNILNNVVVALLE